LRGALSIANLDKLKVKDILRKPITVLIHAEAEPEQTFGKLLRDIDQVTSSRSPLFGALRLPLSAVTGVTLATLTKAIFT